MVIERLAKMEEGLKEKLKLAIELKRYEEVEDIWLNLMELSPEDLGSFYSIADWLAKNKERERAVTLLLLLIEHFKKKGDFKKVLDILKKAAVFNLQETAIRQELIDCSQVLFSNHPQKAELIDTLSKSEVKLPEVLAIFDHYLYFNIGEYFYRPEWGVGKVIESDLLRKKRVVIDFEKKTGHEMSLEAACEVLTKLEPDHFLVVKATDLTRLKNMRPLEIMAFLLKSMNQPLTPQKIKMYLQDIVSEEEWARWWNKVQLEMSKDGQFEISGTNPKTYSWCNPEEAENKIALRFDRATPYEKMELAKEAYEKGWGINDQFLKSLLELARQSTACDPSLAIEIFLFIQELKGEDLRRECEAIIKSCEDLSALLIKIARPRYQLKALEMIKETLAGKWPEIYLNLFFSLSKTGPLEAIIDEFLTSREQEKLETIVTKLSQLPEEYPEQFFLVCKKAFKDGMKLNIDKYELLSALLKLLKKREMKELQKKIKAFLLEDGLLKEHLSSTQLTAFCEAFLEIGGLRLSEKDKLRALLVKKRSKVTKPEETKHIYFYATAESIEAKRQELADIMERQIPDNIKEIAQARSLGDLRENFEYKAAKERQKLLYARLAKLRAQLAQIKVISPQEVTTEKVNIGTKVRLKSCDEKAQVREYTILGPWESDPERGVISYLTAIGSLLLNKRVKDKVVIEEKEWEIVGIEKAIFES